MMRGVGVCNLVGLPVRHAACFQEVANRTRHVVISRAVGSHCTRLLEEVGGIEKRRWFPKSPLGNHGGDTADPGGNGFQCGRRARNNGRPPYPALSLDSD
jgi:hypothetical protein